MRQKKAKKIRKIIYGTDYSRVNPYNYVRNLSGTLLVDPKGKRKQYLDAKKLVKMGVKIG